MRELAAAYANTCLEGPGGFIYPLFNPLIMPAIELIHDREIFTSFWQRAILEVASLHGKPGKDVLYLDPIDLQTQKFFELLRLLTTAQGADEFAVIILKPDPFGYFNFHFGKYPGFVHNKHHTDDEYFSVLMKNPGDSPADAIGINSYQYVVMPLHGNWIVFGDRNWDIAVFHGPPDIMNLARNFYPFFIKPPEGFRIEPYYHREND
ncbi:hypothetical protein [Burkholderia gladioli]|uniref:hypothetical protein n=1 Tax=Burkholderia gladioli TaxID=28095 RepID=UPI001FC84CEF|nr:hypothetical protein [Burkholderia gladioli]